MTWLEELDEAKRNAHYLLDNPDSMIDMHGLGYWVERVQTLRERIKGAL